MDRRGYGDVPPDIQAVSYKRQCMARVKNVRDARKACQGVKKPQSELKNLPLDFFQCIYTDRKNKALAWIQSS